MAVNTPASWAVTWVCPTCGRRGFHTGRSDAADPIVIEMAEEMDSDPEDLVSVPAILHCVKCETALELDFDD